MPHSWDVRADWRSAVPQCSAVMTESYTVLERFPAWFFNLAPADPLRQATPADRPPNVTTAVAVAPAPYRAITGMPANPSGSAA